MYKNLEAELVRYDVSKVDLAKLYNCSTSLVTKKLTGGTSITINEAKITRDYLSNKAKKHFTIEYLFD